MIFQLGELIVVNSTPALLQFNINGGLLETPFLLPTSPGIWQQFHTKWFSGNSTNATISIVDQQTVPSGNDFALDDIEFREICTVEDSVFLLVHKLIPDADFVINHGCESDTVFFSYVNQGDEYPTEFHWEFGDGYTSDDENPTHIYDHKGIYTVELTVSIADCDFMLTFEVDTEEGFVPLAVYMESYDETICLGESVSVTPIVYGNGPFTYQWDIGDGEIYIDEIFEYTFLKRCLDLHIVVEDVYGCEQSEDVSILVLSQPEIVPVENQFLCHDDSVEIDLSYIDDYVVWNDGQNLKKGFCLMKENIAIMWKIILGAKVLIPSIFMNPDFL
ncbi:MAG: PKD domain-containing protein [Saprospiraceae bacterium]